MVFAIEAYCPASDGYSPKDLPNSIKYLDDRQLDRVLAAAIEEAKKRGRPTASLEPGPTRTVVGANEPKPNGVGQSAGRVVGEKSDLVHGR